LTDLKGKTYWLVGASEGLGRALAVALDALGARTVLSARSGARLDDLAETLSYCAGVVACDVTDTGAVDAAWAQIEQFGIDGVIFIAGYYEPISAQDWDREAVMRMADVNFMGGIRVLGHAVPHFANRNSGHIVVIGSLSGYRGLPGAIGYGASKSGLMHLTENIQIDLAKTDVKVQLVNPGYIKTRLTNKNDFAMPFLMSAEAAADRTVRAMHSNRFKTDFPWIFSLVFRVSRLLPNWVYLRLLGA